MSTIRDGGPAFPRPASEYTANGTICNGDQPIEAQQGMSLRDWFAGQALIALCGQGRFGVAECVLAQRSYQVADAMLAARRPQPTNHEEPKS